MSSSVGAAAKFGFLAFFDRGLRWWVRRHLPGSGRCGRSGEGFGGAPVRMVRARTQA